MDLGIHPFKIFHDAAEPVGYCIYYKNIKISIITDTGWVNDNMKNKIKGSSLYLMESNHDVKMLKEGNYPWFLKKKSPKYRRASIQYRCRFGFIGGAIR